MININILTEGFVSPNGKAFLFPLILYREVLREMDICWKLYKSFDSGIYDCDLLIVDSKYHRLRWIADTEGVLQEFELFKRRVPKVFYFDTTDSSGMIQVELLDLVDSYYKSQLLKDRTRYLKSMYGHRFFTDYYHKENDAADLEEEYSNCVENKKLLEKLKVSWNSGLADYSFYGPYLMELYAHIPLSCLLSFPIKFFKPNQNRLVNVQARMRVNYSRESVAWQRKEIVKKLGKYLSTSKLSRWKFFKELTNSKIVVSPFGFGEITLKDYEVFITGGLLFKPDMSVIETWPDLFITDRTMVSHKWDLSDFNEKLEMVLDDYSNYIEIAKNGQENYRRYISKDTGGVLFADHFFEIVRTI